MKCAPSSSASIHWTILGGDTSSCLLDPVSGMAEHFPFLIHLTTAHVLGAYNLFTLNVTVVIVLSSERWCGRIILVYMTKYESFQCINPY